VRECSAWRLALSLPPVFHEDVCGGRVRPCTRGFQRPAARTNAARTLTRRAARRLGPDCTGLYVIVSACRLVHGAAHTSDGLLENCGCEQGSAQGASGAASSLNRSRHGRDSRCGSRACSAISTHHAHRCHAPSRSCCASTQT
jgi:hypothetical protein